MPEDEYEQTYHSCNAICPYCGNSYQVEAEDYDASGVDEECSKCGRVYERHTEIDVTHYCTPKPNAGRLAHADEKLTDQKEAP